MKILLGNGYFVEIDSMNHTLKQKYMGADKQGAEKEYEKTHGYFSNLESAVERYLFLNQIDSMADSSIEMKEYLELVRVANENAVKAFKEVNAYDVEKVVEQLEEKKRSNPSMMFEADCWRKGIDDAIDIVRGGRE